MARPPLATATPRPAIALSRDRGIVLGEELGRGSVATVFRGVMETGHGVKRSVAVKIFGAVASEQRDEVVAEVVRLARRSALVQHPNVVSVYELTVLDRAQPVLVTELVEGRSLAALLDGYAYAGRKLTPDLALFVALEIAEGLAGARDARSLEGRYLDLCHAELSGRDVLVSWSGEVKVADFGMAQAVRSASAVLDMRSLAQRAVTLAPEVANGQRPDSRSDVFSLGVMMHEMLIGPRWPTGTDDAEAFQFARQGYVHVGVFERRLHGALAEILNRALEVEPDHRYPHAGAMAYDLRRAAMSMGVGDGRVFLRQAMHECFAAGATSDPDATQPEVPFTTTGERAITPA